MSSTVYGLKPGIKHYVEFSGNRYGIIFCDDQIGVCRNGFGRVKYMTVIIDAKQSVLYPLMLKTRLKLDGTASDLVHSLLVHTRLKLPEEVSKLCMDICEHILKYGHTPR